MNGEFYDFKRIADYGGYWAKNIKNFKGHDGEPLCQCAIYKDGKRIGFFSDDSWGGPAMFQGFDPDDLTALKTYAKTRQDSSLCADHILCNDLVNEVEFQRRIKVLCKKKIIVMLSSYKEGEYHSYPAKWSDSTKEIFHRELTKKHGDGQYIILNELVD